MAKPSALTHSVSFQDMYAGLKNPVFGGGSTKMQFGVGAMDFANPINAGKALCAPALGFSASNSSQPRA
jgi:hypothetical protein